jgi:hypothetical protein
MKFDAQHPGLGPDTWPRGERFDLATYAWMGSNWVVASQPGTDPELATDGPWVSIAVARLATKAVLDVIHLHLIVAKKALWNELNSQLATSSQKTKPCCSTKSWVFQSSQG